MERRLRLLQTLRPPMGVSALMLAGLCAQLMACAGAQKQVRTKRDIDEQLVLPTLYAQRSAEYRAMCYQAFNVARTVLDEDLKRRPEPIKRAIVVDADETIIQSGAYEAYLIEQGIEYPEEWEAYVDAAISPPLPGVVEFLNYAAEKGVETFYISNRKVGVEHQGTIKNLKRFGFPFVDEKHVLSRRKGENSDKSGRRNEVAKEYEIFLLFGDNLDDFSGEFYRKTSDERVARAETDKDLFGKRYIVLPNAMYGSWEEAIIDYKKGVSPDEKNRKRKAALRPWKR